MIKLKDTFYADEKELVTMEQFILAMLLCISVFSILLSDSIEAGHYGTFKQLIGALSYFGLIVCNVGLSVIIFAHLITKCHTKTPVPQILTALITLLPAYFLIYLSVMTNEFAWILKV